MILYDLVNRHGTHFSPNSWRVRMALAHKGIEPQVRDVLFGGIAGIRPGGDRPTIPTLEDQGRLITDSWEIVRHLDEAYPQTPRLIASGAEGQVLRFFQHWVQSTIHAGVARLVMLDLYNSLEPADQDYFRSSREKQYKMALEDIQAGRDERLDAFRRSLQPMRLSLTLGPFISGSQPGYADYLAFGGFQWARVSSTYPVLAQDDVVQAWFERCLDLYDGLGRREAAAHA